MTGTLRDQLQATLSGTHTLERELGGGGMSKVFVAEETRLGRKVVVKVLSPELAQGISVERFEREIRTAAALNSGQPGRARAPRVRAERVSRGPGALPLRQGRRPHGRDGDG